MQFNAPRFRIQAASILIRIVSINDKRQLWNMNRFRKEQEKINVKTNI